MLETALKIDKINHFAMHASLWETVTYRGL